MFEPRQTRPLIRCDFGDQINGQRPDRVFAPPSPFFQNVSCVRESEILVMIIDEQISSMIMLVL